MWTILDRLKEPSTYAGLSAIMIAFGVSSEQWTTISTALASVAAVYFYDTKREERLMISKIVSSIVTSLLSKGLAALQEYMQKRKVGKLQQQVSSLEDKIKILEQRKEKEKRKYKTGNIEYKTRRTIL